MLLSLRKNGLTSLFKEVRVFKVVPYILMHSDGQIERWTMRIVRGQHGTNALRTWITDRMRIAGWRIHVSQVTDEAARNYGFDFVMIAIALPAPLTYRGGVHAQPGAFLSVSPTEPFVAQQTPCDTHDDVTAIEPMSDAGMPRMVPWTCPNYMRIPRKLHGLGGRKLGYGHISSPPLLLCPTIRCDCDCDHDHGDDDLREFCLAQDEECLCAIVLPSHRHLFVQAMANDCLLCVGKWILSTLSLLPFALEVRLCSPYVLPSPRFWHVCSILVCSPSDFRGGMQRELVLGMLADLEEESAALVATAQRLVAQIEDMRRQVIEDALPMRVDSSSEEENNNGGGEESHALKVRSGPRARREYAFRYLPPTDTFSDLHFEYARVARRGALTFELSFRGHPLCGWHRIDTIPEGSLIEAPRFVADRRDEPLSCLREQPRDEEEPWRGGSPSKLRGALSRKLKSAKNTPHDPVGLVQALWAVAPNDLMKVNGEPEEVATKIATLASTWNLTFKHGSWTRDHVAMAPNADPLHAIDPWAKPRSVTVNVHGAAEDQEATTFEKSMLVSSLVDSQGTTIPQVPRWSIVPGKRQVVLVSAKHFKAVETLVGDDDSFVMILDRLEGTGLAHAAVQKTQVLIKSADETKVLVVYVRTSSSEEVSIVHHAPIVHVEPSEFVPVTLKLCEDACSASTLCSIQKERSHCAVCWRCVWRS